MPDWKLNTPIAFIVFNRPQTARAVFEQIRAARPPQLLVIADGPRRDRPSEAQLCATTRAILDGVDWPCDVQANFSDRNLGCRERVASGIDWVFSQVPEAIILEDDCLPHPSFFRFCAELLERYRDDQRVGMISGTNLQALAGRGDASYYFSKYTSVWGWATWRRAWARYDRSASIWPELLGSAAFRSMTEPGERIYWQRAFTGVHRGAIDTWDYQWTLTSWCESMLSIVPSHNLISNIGFGPDATHTTQAGAYANLSTAAMAFPLSHPRLILADTEADASVAATAFNEPLRSRVRRYLTLAPRPSGWAARNR